MKPTFLNSNVFLKMFTRSRHADHVREPILRDPRQHAMAGLERLPCSEGEGHHVTEERRVGGRSALLNSIGARGPVD